jgi:hypothetical protein
VPRVRQCAVDVHDPVRASLARPIMPPAGHQRTSSQGRVPAVRSPTLPALEAPLARSLQPCASLSLRASGRLAGTLALTAVIICACMLPLPAAALFCWLFVHTRTLYLNSLTGTIPTQVGDMTALTFL